MIEFIAQVSEEDFKKITNGETIFQHCKLVRCRDCERYVPKHRRCEWTWLDRNPEDFCPRGERRER